MFVSCWTLSGLGFKLFLSIDFAGGGLTELSRNPCRVRPALHHGAAVSMDPSRMKALGFKKACLSDRHVLIVEQKT